MKKILLLGIALLILSSFAIADEASDLTDASILYYKLEENAFDYADEVNSVDLTTGALPNRDTGIIDFGQSFVRANSDYLLTDANTHLGLPAPVFSFWFKPQSDNEQSGIISTKSNTGTVDGISIERSNDANLNQMYIYACDSGSCDLYVTSTGFNNYARWYHVFIWFDGDIHACVDGTADGSESSEGTPTVSYDVYKFGLGMQRVDQVADINAYLDEVAYFNGSDFTPSCSYAEFLYNSGSPGSNQQYPFASPTPATYFNLTLVNLYNDSVLLNFTAQISNATGTAVNITTTNGSINWVVNQTINVTVFNITQNTESFFDVTELNHNSSTNLELKSKPYFYFDNYNYSNYVNTSTDNYTRKLIVNISFACRANQYTNVTIMSNGQNYFNVNPNCTNTTNTVQTYITESNEGDHNISFVINTTDQADYFAENETFIYDNINPYIELNATDASPFSSNINISITCIDNITPILFYNYSLNAVLQFYNDSVANLTIINTTEISDGTNALSGTCTDYFGTSYLTKTENIYQKLLRLWDEIDNVDFVVSNLSAARVYFSNTEYFDFVSNNTNTVNFSATNDTQLRFVLTYPGSVEITRFVDVSLVSEQDIKVCANKDDITHFEQQIVSKSKRLIKVKNTFSNCYIAADQARFAYEDAFLLRAFSIDAIYYLVTNIGGVETLLASIDGGIASTINIDTIEFSQRPIDFSIVSDGLAFEKLAETQVLIRYNNTAEDNTNSRLIIKNLDDSSTLLNTNSFTSPNNWTVVFDFSSFNITNNTIFLIQVDNTKNDASTETIKRYFNPQAQVGFLQSGVGAIIAFLLLLFGFTFISASATLGWFGIFVDLIAILVLSLTIPAWYITLLFGLCAILLIYCTILLSMKNFQAVG